MITIRRERGGDEAAIHAIHEASFPTDGEARLVDSLRAVSRLTLSLVAETNESRIVGHVGLSPVTIDGAECGLGLAPLAVLSDYRRLGIGARLVHEGLRVARDELGAPLIVVLGDPHYYGRFGFAPAAKFGLESEYNAGDAFQVTELARGSIPPRGGTVRYAREFAQLAD